MARRCCHVLSLSIESAATSGVRWCVLSLKIVSRLPLRRFRTSSAEFGAHSKTVFHWPVPSASAAVRDQVSRRDLDDGRLDVAFL